MDGEILLIVDRACKDKASGDGFRRREVSQAKLGGITTIFSAFPFPLSNILIELNSELLFCFCQLLVKIHLFHCYENKYMQWYHEWFHVAD